MGAYATVESMRDRYHYPISYGAAARLWTAEDDYTACLRYGRIMGRTRP